MRKKRKYTVEFKQEAVKLVTEKGYSQAEAGRRLGVTSKNISRWIQEFSGKYKRVPLSSADKVNQAELIQLRKENKRLRQERDILKKAAVDSMGHCNT